jgi:hypothetical protein
MHLTLQLFLESPHPNAKVMQDVFAADRRKRMEKFALSWHPENFRLIEFGRYALERRVRRSLAKPDTFNEASFSSSGRRNAGAGHRAGEACPRGLSNWLKNKD